MTSMKHQIYLGKLCTQNL